MVRDCRVLTFAVQAKITAGTRENEVDLAAQSGYALTRHAPGNGNESNARFSENRGDLHRW